MGNLLVGYSVDANSLLALTESANFGLRRSGAVGETMNRRFATAAVQPITAQGVYTAIYLTAGTVVTNITFTSNTTAGGTLTHQIFGLFNSSFVPLAQSADATNAAWAGSTEKTLALTAPYTILTDGVYYLGVAIAATTVPTLCGQPVFAALANEAPPLGFTDTSTTVGATFPNPAIQSAGFAPLYAYVS